MNNGIVYTIAFYKTKKTNIFVHNIMIYECKNIFILFLVYD